MGLAIAVSLAVSARADVQVPQTMPGAAARWHESPAHADLFAPAARRAAYRAFVSPLELDEVLRLLEGRPDLLATPGGWQAAAVSPLDAFGQSGSYDRWGLVRLYGPGRARLARGPRVDRDRVAEAWSLVSPYPDPALQRLESGTLLLVLRLP